MHRMRATVKIDTVPRVKNRKYETELYSINLDWNLGSDRAMPRKRRRHHEEKCIQCNGILANEIRSESHFTRRSFPHRTDGGTTEWQIDAWGREGAGDQLRWKRHWLFLPLSLPLFPWSGYKGKEGFTFNPFCPGLLMTHLGSMSVISCFVVFRVAEGLQARQPLTVRLKPL